MVQRFSKTLSLLFSMIVLVFLGACSQPSKNPEPGQDVQAKGTKVVESVIVEQDQSVARGDKTVVPLRDDQVPPLPLAFDANGISPIGGYGGHGSQGAVKPAATGNPDGEVGFLTIKKIIDNGDGGTAVVADFGISINADVTLNFDAGVPMGANKTVYTAETLTLDDGTYTLKELNLPGYAEGQWDCGDAGGGPFDNGTVNIRENQFVACVIENDDRPVTIGYYEMKGGGGGFQQQEDAILAASALYNAVKLTNVAAADLAGLDVLFVTNGVNTAYATEYTDALADIENFVTNGGKLILHDAFVDQAEMVLPGGGGFDIQRELSINQKDINVRDNTTLVTSGPGGVVNDMTLDGGDFSSHGFAVVGTLPSNGRFILSRPDPDQIVTFSYCFGGGGVVYSSIPLDFYLLGFSLAAFRDIYAPNVIAYGSESDLCN